MPTPQTGGRPDTRPSSNPLEQKQTGLVSTRDFASAIAKYQETIRRLIPTKLQSMLPPDRMIALAADAFNQSKDLQECSTISIINSVMLACKLGLEINTPLGHGWLIPYKRVCTFQPGYRGLIALAYRSGRVHSVVAHPVFEGEDFEIEYGTNEKLIHRPALARPRGEWMEKYIGAYCLVRMRDGGPPTFHWMTRTEIEFIRDKASQSKDSNYSPWKTYPIEMVRKTPTKNHMKYSPLSSDIEYATGIDDQAESGNRQEYLIDAEYEPVTRTISASTPTSEQTSGTTSTTTTGAATGKAEEPSKPAANGNTAEAKPGPTVQNTEPSANAPTSTSSQPAAGEGLFGGLRPSDFHPPDLVKLSYNLRMSRNLKTEAQRDDWLLRFQGDAADALETAQRYFNEWQAKQKD